MSRMSRRSVCLSRRRKTTDRAHSQHTLKHTDGRCEPDSMPSSGIRTVPSSASNKYVRQLQPAFFNEPIFVYFSVSVGFCFGSDGVSVCMIKYTCWTMRICTYIYLKIKCIRCGPSTQIWWKTESQLWVGRECVCSSVRFVVRFVCTFVGRTHVDNDDDETWRRMLDGCRPTVRVSECLGVFFVFVYMFCVHCTSLNVELTLPFERSQTNLVARRVCMVHATWSGSVNGPLKSIYLETILHGVEWKCAWTVCGWILCYLLKR